MHCSDEASTICPVTTLVYSRTKSGANAVVDSLSDHMTLWLELTVDDACNIEARDQSLYNARENWVFPLHLNRCLLVNQESNSHRYPEILHTCIRLHNILVLVEAKKFAISYERIFLENTRGVEKCVWSMISLTTRASWGLAFSWRNCKLLWITHSGSFCFSACCTRFNCWKYRFAVIAWSIGSSS